MKRIYMPKIFMLIAMGGFVLLLILGSTYMRERQEREAAVETLAQAAQRMVAWCDGTANGEFSYVEARAGLYPMASEMYDAMCGLASCSELDPVGLKIYASWTVEMAILNPGEFELPIIAKRILPLAQGLSEACSEGRITPALQNALKEFQYSFAPYSSLPDV